MTRINLLNEEDVQKNALKDKQRQELIMGAIAFVVLNLVGAALVIL